MSEPHIPPPSPASHTLRGHNLIKDAAFQTRFTAWELLHLRKTCMCLEAQEH